MLQAFLVSKRQVFLNRANSECWCLERRGALTVSEPLAGLTVIEMTVAVQGPAAGLYLRDMGAEVIKIEPPLGDSSRYGRGTYNETQRDPRASIRRGQPG